MTVQVAAVPLRRRCVCVRGVDGVRSPQLWRRAGRLLVAGEKGAAR